MAYFKDMSPCTYFGPTKVLRAIGWLESGRQFPTGEIDTVELARLEHLTKWRWRAAMFMGWHDCSLCGNAQGLSNLFVPAGGHVFAAPEMVVHYVREHRYRPPTEFLVATMACPEPGSPDYFRSLRASGLDPVFFTIARAVRPKSANLLREIGLTSVEEWEQKRANLERDINLEYFPDEQPEPSRFVEIPNPIPLLTQSLLPGYRLRESYLSRDTGQRPRHDFLSESWVHETVPGSLRPSAVKIDLYLLRDQAEALEKAKNVFLAPPGSNHHRDYTAPTPGWFSGRVIGDFCWADNRGGHPRAPFNLSSTAIVIQGSCLFQLQLTGERVEDATTEELAVYLADRLKTWIRPG